MKPGKTGLSRIISATRYSWRGICAAFKNEAAFRQEIGLAVVAIPIAYLISHNALQFLSLSVPLLLILLAELANTAIEALVDRLGAEYNELSARAKDMGSAMVFMSLTIAVLCWISILAEAYLW